MINFLEKVIYRIMATIYSQIFKCPVCNTYFEDHVPVNSKEFVYFESDLRPLGLGTDCVPYQVHSCPFCYFTAQKFPKEVDKGLKEFVAGKRILHGINVNALEPYTKYHLLAKVFEFQNVDPFKVAFTYLKASWMARKASKSEKENFYQIRALVRFENILDSGELEKEKKAMLYYLLAELYRRLGYYSKSKKCYLEVITDKFYGDHAQQMLRHVEIKDDKVVILNNIIIQGRIV